MPRRKKVYGRTFSITPKQARTYERVDRPRSLKANPIGVTRMASMNGRGSYRRSARQVASGKTAEQRLSRARSVMQNGAGMAGFLKNRKSPKAVRSAAAKRAGSRTKSTSSRRKVPGTNYYKTPNGRYQNASGKFVKVSTVKSSRPKRRVKRNAAVGASKSYSKGYGRVFGKKKTTSSKSKSPAKRKTAAKAPAKRKTTRRKAASRAKTIGKYTRLRVVDPKTGRKRLSYLYKTSKGKRRKIPKKAIIASGRKTAAQIRKGRTKAATKIRKEGSAFVANKGKSSARQKRAGKRLAAYSAAKRSGASVKKAKAAALRAVPLKQGDRFKGSIKVGTMKKGSKRRVKVGGKKRTLVANRRRKRTAAKRRATPNRRRRLAAAKPRRLSPNRKRRAVAKRPKSQTRKRRTTKRRSGAKRKTYRSNRMRTYRRNQGFMKKFQAAFVTGLWVTGGFVTHKVITNLICDPIFDLFKPKNGNGAEATSGMEMTLDTWKKPLCGLGVLLVGLPVTNMVAKKRSVEIGAGMMASWIHSIVVAAVGMSGNAKAIQAVGELPTRYDWTGRKWPYTGSRAAALGRRRRGMGASHQTSIMPRYTPIKPKAFGAYQAAAGQYQQAAAGQYQQAAAGEYFTPAATGEYFAPANTQGVGQYEGAGQLSMPRDNSTITDGIRPDSNLDREMDIMEAAAGLRGGVGAYTQYGGGGQAENVPTQSQWIPNGPAWAGELQVDATQQTSELSAGILNKPGGNGVLSGG